MTTIKYGVDYHHAEMERCGAEYIARLLCDSQSALAWVTTKGVLYTDWDEQSERWLHEWHELVEL